MLGGRIPQALRRGFRGDVPLGHAQHLVTHHKFLNRRRAQQWRIEMRVQVKFGIRTCLLYTSSLGSAVEMAGGLATTADGQKAVVERIETHNTRRIEEYPLNGDGLERALQDGDVVRIFAVSPRFENAVTLRGNVAHPGRVEWHRGMRLKDVIPNQSALVTRDNWRATNWAADAGERDDQRISRDSVSYTHLDVYKRQLINRNDCGSRNNDVRKICASR